MEGDLRDSGSYQQFGFMKHVQDEQDGDMFPCFRYKPCIFLNDSDWIKMTIYIMFREEKRSTRA